MMQRPWRKLIDPWWEATRSILPIFLATRFLFLILTYCGVVLFTLPNYSNDALPGVALFYSWYRWDAIRYATIAANGYISLEYAAFFPFYPFLEYLVSIPLLHDVYLAGILISNLAFIATLVVLYRFVEIEFDSDTAKRATLYLAIFPSAFFFFAAYNESLFLLLMLLSFYSLRRNFWWRAGIFGGLATLTRSAGLILLPLFIYEFARHMWPPTQELRQAWQNKQYRYILRKLSDLSAALLIPFGLGIYVFYLQLRFDDPLAFFHAQAQWRQGPSPPWYAFVVIIQKMTVISPYTFTSTHNIIDLAAFLLFAMLLIFCFVGPERFTVSQWSLPLFGLLALLYPLFFPGLFYTPLASMERFVLELFPGFILLARLGRRPWFHQWYLILSVPLLAFLLLQFVTDHWTV